jgi:uncharacterized membrane protein YfhO
MGYNYIRSMTHFNTLSNKGSVYGAYDPMSISKGNISVKGQPSYKGEYYFKDSKKSDIELIKRTANKIHLKINADKNEVLVLNQNYHPEWKTKEGFKLVNADGLAGFEVPKGSYDVNIYVFQNKFLIGLILFALACASGFYIMKKY